MPTVNGYDHPCGCQVDGHQGQYVPDQLAVIAESLGWRGDGDSDEYPNEGYSNDPRYWRRVAEKWQNDAVHTQREYDAWEAHHDATTRVLYWLNEHTEPGYQWDWYDGEIFLMPNDWWED